ncbi:hypothetical protein HMPREF9420_2269 [Segatella salivae DSM 15606]|uniref:Uncharacterized protein n=1 Tax=Segatella salivae DSM 15606 TaxID=888832 RepID=E6MS01_9BACT|nr:hypothetical protein HMPREF9420_2269 [Segatella salivae DSM 15606]
MTLQSTSNWCAINVVSCGCLVQIARNLAVNLMELCFASKYVLISMNLCFVFSHKL